jgi:hypothetical protein
MKHVVCVLSLLVFASAAAKADTVHLSANRDTMLLGTSTVEGGYYDKRNYGEGVTNGVGQAGAYYADITSLVGFDVSGIPTGTVDAITLRLYVSGKFGDDASRVYNTSVYAISASNKDWVEYRAVQTPDANGNLLSGACNMWKDSSGAGNVNWASNGRFGSSDYSATALSTVALTPSAAGSYVDFAFTGTSTQLTSLIDGWRTDNAGLAVYAPVSGTAIEGLQFATRENATAAYRPELIVNTVPEPSSLVLLSGALIGLLAYAWRKRK